MTENTVTDGLDGELEEGVAEHMVKGADLFPDEHKYFTFLKKVFRHEFRKGGFRRISTPSLTETTLYTQSGQEEFNEYQIDCDSHFSLKFDSTLSVLDSYIRNEKSEELQPVYYYYIDQLFLKKEHHIKEVYNIGAEIIGESEPILDVELIAVMHRILNSIGLEGTYKIRVNSVGLKKEQEKYKEALKDFYSDKKHLLSEEGIKALEEHPLALLNPTTEDEEILLEQAPKMKKFLKKHSKLHLKKFEEFIELLGIEYEYDETYWGEKQYYTNTVWEIVENDTGKQITYGGRYDTLSLDISDIRKEIPATGFALRVGRMISMLKRNGASIKNKDKLDLYFVQLGDEAKKEVMPVAIEARKAGINTLASLGTPSMKEQMLKAGRSGATYVVMVGIMEARNGLWQLRNLQKGTQDEIKKEDLINHIISKIGKENLDFYSPIRDLTIVDKNLLEEEEEEENK